MKIQLMKTAIMLFALALLSGCAKEERLKPQTTDVAFEAKKAVASSTCEITLDIINIDAPALDWELKIYEDICTTDSNSPLIATWNVDNYPAYGGIVLEVSHGKKYLFEWTVGVAGGMLDVELISAHGTLRSYEIEDGDTFYYIASCPGLLWAYDCNGGL